MTGFAVGAAALTGVAFGWWGVLALVAIVIPMLIVGRKGSAAAVSVLILLAASAGAWRAGHHESFIARELAPTGPGMSTVVTVPARTGQRQYFVAELMTHDRRAGDDRTIRTCVTASSLPAVHLGDVVRLTGESRAAADVSSAQRAGMMARGCQATLFAVSQEIVESRPGLARALADVRSRLGSNLRQSAPGDAGVLLTGLVTGDDEGFSRDREASFLRAGATHLTAVSGSNMALVAGILATAGAATVGRFRRVWLVVFFGGLWSYALVSGAYAPAVRAAIVASAAVLAFHFGRRADFPTLILLAAGAMVLVDPRQIEALGFRLSVAASLALAVVLPGMIARYRASHVSLVIGATIAAQIATLPLLLATFGTVSLGSLPANVLAAPLAAIAMPIAALAAVASAVSPTVGEAIAAPAILAAMALIGVVDLFGAPRGYVSVGVPPLGAALVMAATGSAILLLLSGDVPRILNRRWDRRDNREKLTS